MFNRGGLCNTSAYDKRLHLAPVCNPPRISYFFFSLCDLLYYAPVHVGETGEGDKFRSVNANLQSRNYEMIRTRRTPQRDPGKNIQNCCANDDTAYPAFFIKWVFRLKIFLISLQSPWNVLFFLHIGDNMSIISIVLHTLNKNTYLTENLVYTTWDCTKFFTVTEIKEFS